MIPPIAPLDVHIHYHRPPDRTDRFVQRILRDDPWVKITHAEQVRLDHPLLIDDQVALEDGSQVVWFTFPGAWHDIGRFHSSDGTLTGIYANILVPCTFDPGGVWHTTDLFLDLWIPTPTGEWTAGWPATPSLLDEEELELAVAAGWVDDTTATRARLEADRLIDAASEGRWPPDSVAEWRLEQIRV